MANEYTFRYWAFKGEPPTYYGIVTFVTEKTTVKAEKWGVGAAGLSEIGGIIGDAIRMVEQLSDSSVIRINGPENPSGALRKLDEREEKLLLEALKGN